MTKLTDVVRSIAPHCTAVYLDGFEACAASFDKYGINDSPLRQSHFLGQFLGETGGGVVLQESGAYKTVDRLMQIFGVGHHSAAITESEAEKIIALPMPQREKVIFERVYGAGNPHKMNDLGNRPGDGWPFRGTGPIQSTGRGAAKRWADKLGIAMQDDQLWMLEPKIVFLPSLFEWDAGKLNAFADRNDGRHIRRIINGGYNGLQDCLDWQEKSYAALRDPAKHAETPWQQAQPDTSTSAIQNSINLLGYKDAAGKPLVMDGRYGPATKTAVAWYQTLAGLPVDGIPGPVTLASMNLRFATKRGT